MEHCTSGAIRGSVSCSRTLRQGIELEQPFDYLTTSLPTVPLSPQLSLCLLLLFVCYSRAQTYGSRVLTKSVFNMVCLAFTCNAILMILFNIFLLFRIGKNVIFYFFCVCVCVCVCVYVCVCVCVVCF